MRPIAPRSSGVFASCPFSVIPLGMTFNYFYRFGTMDALDVEDCGEPWLASLTTLDAFELVLE
jgi:hypothetical protein